MSPATNFLRAQSPDDAIFGPMLPFHPQRDFSYLDGRTFSFSGRGNGTDDIDDAIFPENSRLVIDLDVDVELLRSQIRTTPSPPFQPLLLPSTPTPPSSLASSPQRPVPPFPTTRSLAGLLEDPTGPQMEINDSDSEYEDSGSEYGGSDDSEDGIRASSTPSFGPSPERPLLASIATQPPGPRRVLSMRECHQYEKARASAIMDRDASKDSSPSAAAHSDGDGLEGQDSSLTSLAPSSPQSVRRSTRLKGNKRERETEGTDDEGNNPARPQHAKSRACAHSSSSIKHRKMDQGQSSLGETSIASVSGSEQKLCGLDHGNCQYTITNDPKADTKHLNEAHGNADARGRYHCTYTGCTAKVERDGEGYRDKCDRNRHVSFSHWNQSPQYACPHAGCTKAYAHQHTLQRHMTKEHGRQKRVRRVEGIICPQPARTPIPSMLRYPPKVEASDCGPDQPRCALNNQHYYDYRPKSKILLPTLPNTLERFSSQDYDVL
ncbi:hypothetical protein C8Q77DRAFT_1072276 [Trametes polyzona]|nr:hypothetical protein C8Q77DRAFT_1072276 [Trametes polyzona]